jgi:FMN phosphatase YigB (HAD superfamily)
MSPPTLLIFDLGSTLVDGPEHGPARQVADLAGLEIAQKHALHRLLMTRDFEGPEDAVTAARERLMPAAPGLDDALRQVWAAQRVAAYALPGALDTLEALVGAYRLAVLSNIWTPFLAAAGEALGGFLDRHVPAELQVFSCRAGTMKPDLGLLSDLLRRAGVVPRDAVMIGDSHEKDVAPALALGMRAIWVSEDASATGAHVVLPSVAGLLEVTHWSPSHVVADGSHG